MRNRFLILILLVAVQSGHSQDFVNLDFENPILPLSPIYNQVSAGNAIPGWTAYFDGNSASTIGYDSVSLGGEYIFLYDANAPSTSPLDISLLPIQGSYSVLLQGPSPGLETSVAIGQTGTIPSTAQSLTFFGNLAGNLQGGALQVTFNGLPVDYQVTESTANYNIYAADISAYAGQTGQLLFMTPVQTFALLDNIQFSPSPVPEPGKLALGAIGALLLGYRRWRIF
jgi:hypothetical protein